MTDNTALPRRIAWFALWTWSRWLLITVGVLLAISALIGFAIGSLMFLPFDIYIHDVYIRSLR